MQRHLGKENDLETKKMTPQPAEVVKDSTQQDMSDLNNGSTTGGSDLNGNYYAVGGDTISGEEGHTAEFSPWPAPFDKAYPWLKQNLFLGIEPKPEIIAIMTIYFVEGALGLARLAQTFYLKDTLHLGPAELSALTGIFILPWTIKPLYGFLSDGIPLFGYKRRSYLILAGLVGFSSYTALGADFWGIFGNIGNAQLQATIAAFLVSSTCIAFSDVVADGIVVQRTRDSGDPSIAGGLQSLCWGSASLGGLISAYFSGSLLEVLGPQEVFSITAVLPLLVALISLSIDEEPTKPQLALATTSGASADFPPDQQQPRVNDNVATNGSEVIVVDPPDMVTEPLGVRAQADALWSAIKEPTVWRPALFLFLWQSTPTSEGATLYFMTNDLGFGPEFLGRVRLVTAFAGLVGVWAYQKFLRKVAIKDILFWTSIASAPLGLSQVLLITHANRELGIPDAAFVFGDDVALSILGELAFLPTLVLAARICPPGVEATLFATLMSIFNGASLVGTEIGAFLTKYLGVTESNFDNLAMLTVICSVSSLYPLIFINWLDGIGSVSEDDIEEGEQKRKVLDVSSVPRKGLLERDSER
jgi:folate/biopterin transporter